MNAARRALSLTASAWALVFAAHPGRMTVHLTLRVATSVLAVLAALWTKLFVDAAVAGNQRALFASALLLAASASVGAAMGSMITRQYMALSERFNQSFDRSVSSLLSSAPTIEHLERADFLNDVHIVRDQRSLLLALPSIIAGNVALAVQAVAAAAVLVATNPTIATVLVLSVAPAIAAHRAGRVQMAATVEVSERERVMADSVELATSSAAAKEVRVYRLADELRMRYAEASVEVVRQRDRGDQRALAVNVGGWLVFAAGYTAVACILAVGVAQGRATAGDLALVVLLGAEINTHVAGAALLLSGLTQALPVLSRYTWLANYVRERQPGGSTRSAPIALRKGLEILDLSFRYPGTGREVLHDVSVDLPAGATVALIGENGAGKTTLVKLLARLYEPTTGTIRADGDLIGDLDLVDWRSRVAGIFQEFARPEVTAEEVVHLGDLAAPQHALLRSVVAASASPIVRRLPRGLASQLGRSFEGGTDLSGGEWQRLALARGLMRQDPLLLLLDEPTSAIDALAESELLARYARAAKLAQRRVGTVTLITSHRLWASTLADLVVVLERGTVVEVGTHDALLSRRGTYAAMHNAQARGFS